MRLSGERLDRSGLAVGLPVLAALLVIVCAAAPSPALAADYFVDPAGADSNSGLSVAQSFRTVAKGVSVAGAGDTVHLRTGSYDETVRLRSGAPGNPVTIVADGAAVMDAHSRGCPAGKSTSAGAAAEAFYGNGVHDVVLDGIEVTGYCYEGVDTLYSDQITIRNMYVHHNGLNLRKKGGSGIAANHVDNLLLEDNVVTDNVPHSYISGSGISVFGSDQVIVRDNVSDRNNGNGILIEDVTNGLVERNVARHNVGDFGSWGTAGIWLDGGHDVTLRRNWLEGNVWDGLDVSDEDRQNPYAYEIHDNVVIGGWYGLRLDAIGDDSQAPNLIYNNSFIDAGAAAVKIVNRDASPTTNTRLTNNIGAQLTVDAPALQVDVAPYSPNLGFEHNLYWRAGGKPVLLDYPEWVAYNTGSRAPYEKTFAEYQALRGWDASSISADPLFVNPGAADYHLSAASPATDAGLAPETSVTDYDGHARPQGGAPDIGALEGAGPCAPGACVTGAHQTSAYDSQVRPIKAAKVKIPAGSPSVVRVLKVSVRNGDAKPKDQLGHRIALHASDGTCPAGTVSGVPAFRENLRGPSSSVFMSGGRTLPAQVKLTIDRAAFTGVTNCTLQLWVTTPLLGNTDPLPANDSASVALTVSAL